MDTCLRDTRDGRRRLGNHPPAIPESISSEPQRRGEGRHELRNLPRFAPRQRRRYLHIFTTHALAIGSGEVVNLLNTRQAANDDLSDEQLDMVVGGVSPVDRQINAFIGEMTQFWSKPII